MNMVSMIFAFGGGGWGGLRYLTVHYEALSETGRWILLGLFAMAVLASACSSWWMTALARRSAAKRVVCGEWIAVPNAGYWLPLVLFFFLMPVCGFFSGREDTWWILLIFGWLAVSLILVFMHELRIGLAVMKADGEYWLSRRCGLGGWKSASSLTDLSAQKTKFIGYNSYNLYYHRRGRTVKFGCLSDANFPSSALPHLLEFIRVFKQE